MTSLSPQQIIMKKRDGGVLSKEDIQSFIDGAATGQGWQDYQLSAMLMAIFLKGMTVKETSLLCEGMMKSGDVIELPLKPGQISGDKHSTGGVGDGISLVLAPIMASLGMFLPMVSGRGLGHTGGTLDKLESIPGFNVSIPIDAFVKQVMEVGAIIAGQTGTFCPADKKLYSLRDVTATVDSIPLIACSIMSKKMAENPQLLVLDVKYGSAAFMVDAKDSKALARAMVDIGKGMGKRCKAVITNMDEPLGSNIGNALEVVEALDILKGKVTSQRYLDVTFKLGEEMLIMAGMAKDGEEGRKMMESVIKDGSALKKMKEIIIAQGGDGRVVDDYSIMPVAKLQIPIKAESTGFISKVDPIKMAYVAFDLGAGRIKAGEPIDLAVGVSNVIKVGTSVKPGDILCVLHANDQSKVDKVMKNVKEAIEIVSDVSQVKQQPLILEMIE